MQSCEPKSYLYVVGMAALNMLWIGAAFVAVNFIAEWSTLKVLPRMARDFLRKKLHKGQTG